MNGHLTSFLTWAILSLLGLTSTLIGIILKMHTAHDKETDERQDKEIEKLRNTVHELRVSVGELQTRESIFDRPRK